MNGLVLESEDFTVPPGELKVVVVSRDRRVPDDPCITAVKPAYLTTCYDELTRNYVVMSVASSLPPEVETVPYAFEKDRAVEAFPDLGMVGSPENSPLSKESIDATEVRKVPVLQHFGDGDVPWHSTLRTTPPNTSHLLNRYPSSDYNIFLRFDTWDMGGAMVSEPFEPLFVTMTFYHVRDKRATRISENFRVDITPAAIKNKFREAYFALMDAAKPRGDSDPDRNDSTKLLEVDPVTKLTMAICAFPEQLKKSELFLVVQVHKVLSGEASSAVAPYLRPSYASSSISSKDKDRTEETIKRLRFYRQQIGIGAVQLFDDHKKVGTQPRPVQMYATRSSFNDDHVGEFVHDLYPTDGQTRSREATQLIITCTLLNLGQEKDVNKNLRMHPGMGNREYTIAPSQYWSSSMDADLCSWEGTSLDGLAANSVVRRLEYLPLPPHSASGGNVVAGISSPPASGAGAGVAKPAAGPDMSALTLRRHLRTGMDHILFVHPMQYDRFQFRNLSCCIRIIEFKSRVLNRFPVKSDVSKTLCNIYNNQQGGPLFCAKVLTTVWHHDFSPSSTDEIKIRLPPILTDRHWLEFEVRHVHIKLKTSSGVAGFFAARKDADDQKPEVVGVGYLQLLPQGLTMLAEGRHLVYVRKPSDPLQQDDTENYMHGREARRRQEEADAKLPFLVVGTRCMSTFKSTDPVIQKALSWGPIPLGQLPSSILHRNQRALTVPWAPSEQRASACISGLRNILVTAECTNHFLVLMRHLVRGMCGGNGLYADIYTSPYEHAPVRCQSFLTLLQLFGRLVPDVKVRREGFGYLDMDVLTAYIEYMFDEEVPERGQSVKFNRASVQYSLNQQHLSVHSNVSSPSSDPRSNPSGSNKAADEIGPVRADVNDSPRPDAVDASAEDMDYEENSAAPRRQDFDDSVETYEDARSVSISMGDIYQGAVNASSSSSNAALVRTPTFIAEESYLDHQSWHAALQMERMLLEALIESSVNEIIQSAHTDDADAALLDVLNMNEHAAAGLRWWSEEIYADRNHHHDDERAKATKMERNRNRSSPSSVEKSQNGQCFSRAPFQPESSWFKDAGEDGLEGWVSHPATPVPTTPLRNEDSASIELVRCSIKHSVLEGYSSRKEKILSARAAAAEDLCIQTEGLPNIDLSHLGKYSMGRSTPVNSVHSDATRPRNGSDSTMFANDRANIVSGGSSSSSSADAKISISLSGTPSHMQWWPWAYEVITYQWLVLLCVLQKSPQPELPFPLLFSSVRSEYPIPLDSIPKDQTKFWFDTRHLALSHGPSLFRMIIKSLALRIYREKKRGLVVLDEDYMLVLTKLLEAISFEALLPTTDLIGARNLVAATTQFCMTLFGMVVPGQVAHLITTLATALRRQNGVKQVELRLLCIEYFSYFDQFVGVNAALPSDASMSLSKCCGYLRNLPLDYIQLFSNATALCIQGTLVVPHPHWLAELVVRECMTAYRLKDQVVSREASLRILLELLGRISFDSRYQSERSRQRVALLFVPLLGEILAETESLVKLPHNSQDRKGLLTLLLYLLQDLPRHLLREILRTFCDNTIAASGLGSNMGDDDYGEITVATSLNERGQPVGSTSPLFRNPPTPTIRLEDASPVNSHLTLWQMLNLLHLLLDTFEVTKGGDLGSPAFAMSQPANSQENINSVQTAAQAFSPNPNTNSLATISNDTAGKLSAVELLEQAQMDRINKIRGSARVGTDKQADTAGEDRMKHYRDKRMSKPRATSTDTQGSDFNTRTISVASSTIVASTLLLILEECPHRLLYGIRSDDSRRINPSALIAAGTANVPGGSDRMNPHEMSRLLEACLAVILHALHTTQSESVLVQMFDVAVVCLKRFGARLFITVVGDSMQDWARCSLKYCAVRSARVNQASARFILSLFRACFYYFGSIHVTSDVFLAVLDDVVEDLLRPLQDQKRTYDDDDNVLQPLVNTLASMQEHFRKRVEASKTLSGHSGTNYSAYYTGALNLLEGLQLLIRADAQRRRHVSHQVGYDWSGVNMLDGPFENLSVSAHQVQIMRMNRINLKENPDSKRPRLETEEVMDLFLRAAAVFDPVRLPRQHIRWLESLARFGDLKQYRAEAGVARWRIFNVCLAVRDTWMTAWAPRQPLQWRTQQAKPGLAMQALVSMSSLSANAAASNATLGEDPNARNFLSVLYATCSVPGWHWQSVEQYTTHLETCLEVSIQRFTSMQLLYLAQRSFESLTTIQRTLCKTDKVSEEYLKMATLFKSVLDCGTFSYAMGAFYWVQYVGRGVPQHLRREFVYRSPNNMHVSEFHALILKIIKDIVAKDTVVRISALSAPSDDDVNSPDCIIFLTNVKPLYRIPSATSSRSSSFINSNYGGIYDTGMEPDPSIAQNQVKEFQHFVPFTQNSKKAHAKTMDQQWKRSIVFSVPHFFPYCSIRQPVYSKTIVDMTPIEVAIDDIRDRVLAMTEELGNDRVGDTNNLMRLIQGTVLPQVNAGAGEVARVFLPRCDGTPDTRTPEASSSSPELVQKLKVTLFDFLELSKSLLAKSRRVLLTHSTPDPSTGGSPQKEASEDDPPGSNPRDTPINVEAMVSNPNIIVAPRKDSATMSRPENTNVIWQSEMERGYDVLMESIYLHISDLPNAASLRR